MNKQKISKSVQCVECTKHKAHVRISRQVESTFVIINNGQCLCYSI